MTDKISFLKFNNYINRNLSEYLSGKTDYNITEIIEYIKDNFNKDEVIPTLLNIIDNDIESKELIMYLDLINYYISVVSESRLNSFKNLISEKLQNLLSFISKTENRSIIYQYIIDYSALYDIDVQKLKKKFPIDREMFLKKVVELASSKTYLRFLLMYEVYVFFSKNELDYMWPSINLFTDKEKTLFFQIFINSFKEKNQKRIFKFIAKSTPNTVSAFIPTLNFYFKDKELYFKNILSVTADEFNKFSVYQVKNGLFSQSKIYFSTKSGELLFLSDFFEYKKYTIVIKTDFRLNYISSRIVKQPMIFNRGFFSRNYKKDFPYQLRVDPIVATELYKGILFKIKTRDLDTSISLLNYFTFRNTMKPVEYQFTIDRDLKIENFYVGKHIFEQIIKNNLHNFIDFEYLIPRNISSNKKEIKSFIHSHIFKIKIDKYINENKTNILDYIKVFIELSKSLGNKKDIINFFILLYRNLENTKSNYMDIEQLKHLILFYLSHENEVNN